ncbi:ATP-NAD kinase [Sinorhizobium meliloti]|uniref:Probabable inorganic polyphosphate/ATP-NAD kinase n=1 Tax=Sinorhizobium meliloti (strain SM11) TaxID=707241 RepID=F7XC98_SINMM|nr:NAD(+)/NADH kinase [Sinorhizobium meliloti]AEH81389.1 probabable inorganic polyphosphate/ATP-NAD kinase [Sinorhizobium meliloti SM11]ARS67100.1 ATP-NAD kinase [Sinorhizobium meliloti RU11/001]MDE3763775.1 NAD(+)/NADH kinase [Sinorhizobium meliloti]MDE3776133.1 NAD(+)/NADH kinase [Sinorhizobium meliloti]MDE3805191.1 NAD(+)/NADH kinase [Sinorhizobium meliloti]
MKIAFRASPRPRAQGALKELSGRYGQTPAAEADFIVAIGGDGTALEALHEALAMPAMPAKPVFAMRTDSSTGILCNSLRTHDLTERLQAASSEELPVLQAEIEQVGGRSRELFAINEIVLERQVFQQAKLSVAVRGNGDPMNINGDGLVLTTPIGSTGYNRTLGGPLLPLGSSLMAVTGKAIGCPPAWSPIVLCDHSILDVEVIEAAHRPVQIATTSETVLNISRARLFRSPDRTVTLLVDREAQGRLGTPFGRQC